MERKGFQRMCALIPFVRLLALLSDSCFILPLSEVSPSLHPCSHPCSLSLALSCLSFSPLSPSSNSQTTGTPMERSGHLELLCAGKRMIFGQPLILNLELKIMVGISSSLQQGYRPIIHPGEVGSSCVRTWWRVRGLREIHVCADAEDSAENRGYAEQLRVLNFYWIRGSWLCRR